MYCPNCGVSNPPGAVFCNACGKELPPLSTSVTCPFCGADGQEYQFNCTKCGKELPRERKIYPLSGTAARAAVRTADAAAVTAVTSADATTVDTSPETPPSRTTNSCPICGRPKSIFADKCEYCNRPDSDSADYSSETTYVRETELPKIGGVLILIAGMLGVFWGLLLMASIASVNTYGTGSATCCAGLFALFGLIAIFGGFSAIGRRSAAFAIVGGVFGMLSVGFYIGALLSLIGLILVAMSYHEFEG